MGDKESRLLGNLNETIPVLLFFSSFISSSRESISFLAKDAMDRI